MSTPFGAAPTEISILPRSFIERVIREVRDLAELKVILLIATAQLEGQPFYAAPEEWVRQHPSLHRGLHPVGTDSSADEAIERGIERAVAHGLLVRILVRHPQTGAATNWLLLGTTQAHQYVHQLAYHTVPWPTPTSSPALVEPVRPSVFQLYEQNIGPLTPLLAEKIAEALEEYPVEWVQDAIEEAVSYGKRHWRYIQRILERWAAEGRETASTRRNHSTAEPLDPAKYLTGKYAPLFRPERDVPGL